jgi:hypothetical protein
VRSRFKQALVLSDAVAPTRTPSAESVDGGDPWLIRHERFEWRAGGKSL